MARMQATVMIRVTVDFDDDGVNSLKQQATKAALFELGLPDEHNAKIGDAYINGTTVVTDPNSGVHRIGA